jgi:exportin-1
MTILKLLSEEIFDYSAEQMTQAKTKNLKNQMCGEFSEIFNLCTEVLEKANKPSLIKATLETLLRFLNWIPLGFIFETNLIDNLITRVSCKRELPALERFHSQQLLPLSQFLEPPEFRNVTLRCLGEIGGLDISADYNQKFVVLFQLVMTAVNKMIPYETGERGRNVLDAASMLMNLGPPLADFVKAYPTLDDEDQMLIKNLALFLTNYLSVHLRLIEAKEHHDLLTNAHFYLTKISSVDDREIFKICLEYWQKVGAERFSLDVFPTDVVPELSTVGERAIRGDSARAYRRGYEPAHGFEPWWIWCGPRRHRLDIASHDEWGFPAQEHLRTRAQRTSQGHDLQDGQARRGADRGE